MPRLFRHNVRPIIILSVCRNMWPSVRCKETDRCMLNIICVHRPNNCTKCWYYFGTMSRPQLPFRHAEIYIHMSSARHSMLNNFLPSGLTIMAHAEIIAAYCPVSHTSSVCHAAWHNKIVLLHHSPSVALPRLFWCYSAAEGWCRVRVPSTSQYVVVNALQLLLTLQL